MSDYGGTKRTGVPVKTLKKLLKKAGLKVSGKKATLTRRAKKARLLKGGLGRPTHSRVASLFNKVSNDQFNKEQAPFIAEQAKFNEGINEVRKNAEALNPLVKKEEDRKRAQAEYEAEQNVQHAYDGTGNVVRLPGSGKKKRSSRV